MIGEPFGAGNELFPATCWPVDYGTSRDSSICTAIATYRYSCSRFPERFVCKSDDDITVVITRFDPGNSGFAFPAFGEGYADFGFIGVALCGIVLGERRSFCTAVLQVRRTSRVP